MENDILPRLRRESAGKSWEEIPGIRGSRAAYRAFGRNPGRYRVSSEALLRRVKRGEGIPPVNTVVDVNNMISLQSGLSLGSYDLSRIKGAVRLRRAGAGEGYRGIGKDFLDMENMLVLSDDEGIFGSSMSDSTRAMLTEDARNILTVIYCFEKEIPLDELLCQAKATFEKYAGAKDVEIGSV
ncbi:MAG: B3/4 domain-containing protein, partial [Oribacterium sp.]